jgi:hydrogenase nickel incorporation protein HypA/HybF
MHELAIADSVVRIASAHAAGRRVAKVELKVGHLRQVVPSALEFSFALVAEGTELEGAELAVEVVPAGGRCRACGFDGPLPQFPLQCQACGGFDVDVLRGEELLVDALEIEDEALIGNGGMARGD